MGVGEILVTLLSGVGQIVGVRTGTEEPKFVVVEQVGPVEIRHYGPRLAAETLVTGSSETARNEGFRRIAGYIFGGNASRTSVAMTAPVVQGARGRSESIAMTAPVVQSPTAGEGWAIQFIMPAKYTRETLPVPNDPRVRVVEVPAQDYAVLRFSGSRSADMVVRKTRELDAALATGRWQAAGAPVSWFYDPPWTMPAMRRNEVAYPVSLRPASPGK